jgi:hypothetical protein
MKHIIKFFSILFLLCFALQAQAQVPRSIRSVEYNSFTQDTLTNADTSSFLLPYKIDGRYDMSWIVALENSSGTSSATAYLYASNCLSCSDFALVDTVALSSDKMIHVFEKNDWPGVRAKVEIISSGTQSTFARNHWFFRRKD